MHKPDNAIVALLRDGRTCTGRQILIEDAHIENYARIEASQVNEHLTCLLLQEQDGKLAQVLAALQANLNNPVHYGGWQPGAWSVDGKQLLIGPAANYWDLIGYGMSGEDGEAGFLRDCGLPENTPYVLLIGCAGLLLVDDSIAAFDSGEPWRGFALLFHAHEAAAELSTYFGEASRRDRNKARSTKALDARHEKNRRLKLEAFKLWSSKQWPSQAECVRVLHEDKQFLSITYETKQDWIAEAKKLQDSGELDAYLSRPPWLDK